MSTHKEHGLFIYKCDYCGTLRHTQSVAFLTALRLVQSAGWSMLKWKETWQHFCCVDCHNKWRHNAVIGETISEIPVKYYLKD